MVKVVSLVLLVTLFSSVDRAGGAELAPKLRERVINAKSPVEAKRAYKAYFTAVTRERLVELLKDSDAGIGLQAAWEVHKQVVPDPLSDSGSVYSRDKLCDFITYLETKAKVAPPGWWHSTLMEIDVYDDRHSSTRLVAKWPEFVKSEGRYVPKGVELRRSDNSFHYESNGKAITFPAADFRDNDSFSVLVGAKKRFIAGFSIAGGFRYRLSEIGEDGLLGWTAEGWATGCHMVGGFDVHRVELIESDRTLYVFGATGSGVYVEAFDSDTGTVRFRFSSCYWGAYSEGWDGF